jgi:hypothetical protein
MELEKGFNERSQDCKHFFWKGEIGNYRNFLNEDQIEQIINYNEEAISVLLSEYNVSEDQCKQEISDFLKKP